jgi:hypothetical protein
MPMPQYTAEAALYNSEHHYSQISFPDGNSVQSVVQAFPVNEQLQFQLFPSTRPRHTPCDPQACVVRTKQDHDACLWRCPAIEYGFEPPSTEAGAACRNACDALYSQNVEACDFVGCEARLSCCAGTCVDASSDSLNCGACSNRCDDGVRVECCGGVCRDLSDDPENCSYCGNDCSKLIYIPPNASAICTTGRCDYQCDPEFSPCGDSCFDFHRDSQNCGSCGVVCRSPQTCQGGKCLCPDGKSLNTSSNCGSCGFVCPSPQTCQSGRCLCPDGKSLNSNSNCGSCGTVCPSPQTCQGGRCLCPDGKSLNADSNCGSCGTVCPSGGTCQNGKCQCPSGTMVCGGRCTNLKTDAANCGRCGNNCPGGMTCQGGTCGCPQGWEPCGGGCCPGGTCCGLTCMGSSSDTCCNSDASAWCPEGEACCLDDDGIFSCAFDCEGCTDAGAICLTQ